LVKWENGIVEATQEEQINDDGEGCCWLQNHGDLLDILMA